MPGYKATIVNLLDGNKKNNWFRPVDVRTAPDGSLFVTDWYDPGVGGHAQADSNRGRIFRVSPKGNSKYVVPAFEFKAAAGAAVALTNPCSSVRYLAWTALHKMGADAEPELFKLWLDNDPRIRARALWLLGRFKMLHYVKAAFQDSDPDVRITGLRLARERKAATCRFDARWSASCSPIQTWQCCVNAPIALRHDKSAETLRVVERALARRYQGNDRWYLEALGIGADKRWDEYLNAYLQSASRADTPQKRDIVWRSRSIRTPALLAEIIRDPENAQRGTAAATSGPLTSNNLAAGHGRDPPWFRARRSKRPIHAGETSFFVEAVKRLKNLDAATQTQVGVILEKTLQSMSDKAAYIELVAQFKHQQALSGPACHCITKPRSATWCQCGQGTH